MKRSFLSLSVLLFMFPVLLCSCDCRKNCAVNTAENGAISQTMPQKKFPSVFPESWKNCEFLAHEYKNIKPGIDYFHFHFKEFEDTGKPLSVYLVEIDWISRIYMPEQSKKWRNFLISFAKRIGKPDAEVYKASFAMRILS